jgi:hypothetical protein
MIFVAEEQGTIDIQVPSYVTQRGEIESEISETEKLLGIAQTGTNLPCPD